jgi:hypothetical protein
MKQEDKNLLIQDLCARLPYGVKIKTSYNKIDEPIELRFINPRSKYFAIGGSFTLISGLDFDTYECKPYLFPMSNMTDEQKEFIRQQNWCIAISTSGTIETTIEGFNWLNKNHFDYRGLIPMDLAIDCTNLNIY